MHGDSHGPWYYQQIDLGFNYRMTDMQAALGCSQLKRLDTFVAQRTQFALRYNSLLANLSVHAPYQHPDTDSAWHLYVIQLEPGTSKNITSAYLEIYRRRELG